MDIPPEEIADDKAGDPYQYDFHQRVNTYDPNMCSTAVRLSPLYNGPSIECPPEAIAAEATYENIILVHSDEIGEGEEARDARSFYHQIHPSLIKYGQIGGGADGAVHVDQLYCNETVQEPHVEQAGEINFNYVAGEQIATQVIGTFLHRSPNGHIYQNYYVTNEEDTNEEIVEMVQITANGDNVDADAVAVPYVDESATQQEMDYEFHTEIEERNEFIDGLGVHLDNGEKNVDEQFFNPQNELSSEVRDDRRILLESTMLPLLAAVNDITQRDAELQSYLNQSMDRENLFAMPLESRQFEEKSTSRRRTEQDDSEEDDDYLFVSDKPVESRAKASLPTNYLYINILEDDNGAPSVLSKKDIPARTKFGPIEGEIRFTSDIMLDVFRTQTPRHYPLLLIGESRILEVSNEETSNWMRYVRMAQTFAEQNLHLLEEDGKLYFKCCRKIRSNEELKVGYSNSYAERYGLHILLPTEEDKRKMYEENNPWPCFECDARFPTSKEMQKHLNVHDNVAKPKSKRKLKKTKKQIQRIMDMRKNSIRCFYCMKVFMTNASLKKHLALHLEEKRMEPPAKQVEERTRSASLFKCNSCSLQFPSEELLKSHKLTHTKNDQKPYKCSECDQRCATPAALAAHIRSHSNRPYTCVYCQQGFRHVITFKNHVATHAVDGVYDCHHCKKKYQEYNLVRKHIRIFHPEKKHPCNECGRLFLHISFLRRHKTTHSEKKQFSCSQCQFQFRRKDKLKEHIRRVHSAESRRKQQHKKVKIEEPLLVSVEIVDDGSQYLKLSPKKTVKSNPPDAESKEIPESYYTCQYKCDECLLGFKRRGMLVNHMNKRHPDVRIESIAELNIPILKAESLFYCDYCSKVYKSNAKRKLHILKNHPGEKVPAPLRGKTTAEEVNVKTVGNVQAEIQKCEWCYKQYSSRTKLLAHYRKAHSNLEEASTNQQWLEEPFQERVSISRSPSPENKLLKLSSAAMKLSSIEDQKFINFLNERADDYRVVDNEFSEHSSATDLNRFPQLFEEI